MFTLKKSNPDFLLDLGDYHALIVWSGIKDPKTEFIGTGPFMIDKYLPEDRLTFKKNPNYWMKDAEGNQLPYLDGMEFIFMAEPSAQVEALRGGQVDYLLYLPSEFVKTLKEDQNIQVLEKPSNTAYVLRMRSDKKPFDDAKVRQAFKAATDNAAILAAAFEGLGVVGHNTPVRPRLRRLLPRRAGPDARRGEGEATADRRGLRRRAEDHPDRAADLAGPGHRHDPEGTVGRGGHQRRDPAGAVRRLLRRGQPVARSGPGDHRLGLARLPAALPGPGLRLQRQVEREPLVRQGTGRPVEQAAVEMDRAKRAELYKQIQQIFIDRGPIIVPFFANNLWGASAKLKGLKPTSYLGTALDLRTVYFEK